MARRYDGVAVYEISGPSPARQRGDRQARAERILNIYSQPLFKVRERMAKRLAISIVKVEGGAVKRTRTSTPVKELAPQASASTSSAMTALFRLASADAKRRRSSNKSPPRRQAWARRSTLNRLCGRRGSRAC